MVLSQSGISGRDFKRDKQENEGEKQQIRTHNVWCKEVKRGGIKYKKENGNRLGGVGAVIYEAML